MDITPPASDKGTERLKLENENRTVKPTTTVAPYPRVESSEERHERQAPETVERRRYRRRSEDRRKQRSETRFDTRSGEERRKEKRRKVDREESAEAGDTRSGPTPGTGVDELA